MALFRRLRKRFELRSILGIPTQDWPPTTYSQKSQISRVPPRSKLRKPKPQLKRKTTSRRKLTPTQLRRKLQILIWQNAIKSSQRKPTYKGHLRKPPRGLRNARMRLPRNRSSRERLPRNKPQSAKKFSRKKRKSQERPCKPPSLLRLPSPLLLFLPLTPSIRRTHLARNQRYSALPTPHLNLPLQILIIQLHILQTQLRISTKVQNQIPMPLPPPVLPPTLNIWMSLPKNRK